MRELNRILRDEGYGRFLLKLATTASVCLNGSSAEANHSFAIGTNGFLLDGKPFVIRCGEVHAPRVPREYWLHRMQMAKAMGLNTVCAYFFWNLHEPPAHARFAQ